MGQGGDEGPGEGHPVDPEDHPGEEGCGEWLTSSLVAWGGCGVLARSPLCRVDDTLRHFPSLHCISVMDIWLPSVHTKPNHVRQFLRALKLSVFVPWTV